jgi:hypothetical protein
MLQRRYTQATQTDRGNASLPRSRRPALSERFADQEGHSGFGFGWVSRSSSEGLRLPPAFASSSRSQGYELGKGRIPRAYDAWLPVVFSYGLIPNVARNAKSSGWSMRVGATNTGARGAVPERRHGKQQVGVGVVEGWATRVPGTAPCRLGDQDYRSSARRSASNPRLANRQSVHARMVRDALAASLCSPA